MTDSNPERPFSGRPYTLHLMYEAQRALQIEAYGADPTTLTGDEAVQFIKDMNLALQDELHELLGEVGWKPWATSRHINHDMAKAELVDAWHFFMNLMLILGMTPDELFDRYMEKRKRNSERQEEGYDGVGGKCALCRRAIDDVAKSLGVPMDHAYNYINGQLVCAICEDGA